MPAATPEATKPLAAVTLIPAPPRAEARRSRAGRARGSRSARPGRRRPCRGCRSRRRRSRGPGCPVGEHAELGGVGALHARELGRDALREHASPRARSRTRPRAARADVGVGLDVAGRDQAAPDRQQVRDEADREAERLLDLGRVLVRADLVGRDVLEHDGRVRARLQRPCRRRRRPTWRRRRRRSGRRRPRAARARAARRSRSSRGSRSAAPSAGRAPGSRSSSPAATAARGCSKPYHSA